MKIITRLRQPTIITHSLALWGGGSVPILSYWKNNLNDGKVMALVIRSSQMGFLKVVLALFFSKRIIVDGLRSFSYLDIILLALFRTNLIIMLHETQMAFEQFESQHSLRYQLLKSILKRRLILCASEYQQNFLLEKFDAKKTEIVFEPIEQPIQAFSQSKIQVLMIGYWSERKGVSFFSKLADFSAQHGSKYEFNWIGAGSKGSLYFSEYVNWIKESNHINEYIDASDIFLLSSQDEPMGLSFLEALRKFKKGVIFEKTGAADLVKGVRGFEVFKQYTVECAFEAIEKVVKQELDTESVESILEKLSLDRYTQTINKFIGLDH